MENIYTLGERFRALSDDYDMAKAALESIYEENGGEVTDETDAVEAELEAIERMKQEVISDVLSAPDDYAAIVKNAEAQKKVLEAELKAVKEEQAKYLARIEAKIKRKQDKIDWFKENIAEALRLAQIEKLGGAKTENKFCIYFTKSTSVETDAERLIAPYKEEIDSLIASLPSWLTVKTDINKTALKKVATLPEGASLNTKETLQIK